MKKERISKPPQKNRERIRIDIEKQQAHNEYYGRVASRYRVLKYLSLAVLLAYLIVMLSIYGSEITYDNLMYLVKDMDTDVSHSTDGFKNIVYEENGTVSCSIFKNNLAVASKTGFTLYNTAGAKELEDSFVMESPSTLTSEKYALVYDIGGTDYSLYTSIAKVMDKSSEYDIQDAALSDSGAFAIVSRSRENRYAVEFYNENFKTYTAKLYKDSYVMDVAIDSEGVYYAVISTDMVDSDFMCEVTIGRTDSQDMFTTRIDGALPLSVFALENDIFGVICDRGVFFFSNTGAQIGEYRISSMTLRSADFCGDKILIAGSEDLVGSSSKAVLLNTSGEVVYSSSFDGKVNRAALSLDKMYLLFDSTLKMVSFDGTVSEADVSSSANHLLPYGNDVVVCTNGGASMGFGSEEEKE